MDSYLKFTKERLFHAISEDEHLLTIKGIFFTKHGHELKTVRFFKDKNQTGRMAKRTSKARMELFFCHWFVWRNEDPNKMDYATWPLEITSNKVQDRYKIDIDNNRGVPLILTLDNED